MATLPGLPSLPPIGSTNPFDQGTPINIGGITGTFHGDPNTLNSADITDPNGIPVPLAGARPSNTPTPSQGVPWYSYLNPFSSNFTGASSGGFLSWLSDPLRLVMFILGLILIAAGLFAFRAVQDTVVQVGKKGAELAA